MISRSILIKNARVIDPSQSIDEKMDILIEDGLIKSSGANLKASAAVTIQADGLVACPGFIDLHCHLREPGFEEKETIASGAAAAIRGGYTTICCMPNTNPPLDNAATVDFVRKTAASQAPLITVLPVGCITKGRAGKELTDMSELADAGCVGFSDDGSPVSSSQLMLLAMRCAAGLEIPIIDHCEDLDLSRGGHLHDGWVAARLGIKGIPAAAEESMVARDIALAEMTGATLHLTHISTTGFSGNYQVGQGQGRESQRRCHATSPHAYRGAHNCLSGGTGRSADIRYQCQGQPPSQDCIRYRSPDTGHQ